VLAGHPADAISRTAREEGASLVVGKRGRNPLQELVLGRTAEAVCRYAARPVLLVPSNSS
jgi:nucleotide-binding universal stress UspA family protein